MEKKDKIKIVIAEADKSYRDIFTNVSENDSIKVIGEASSEYELFQQLPILKPDIVIVDLFLTKDKIGQTVQAIKKLSQFTKILVLSFDISERLVKSCLKTGVACFCDKSIINGGLLQDAIQKMNTGQSVVLIDQKF